MKFAVSYQVYVSETLGIRLFPEDAIDVDNLLLFADKTMYQPKNNGGGGYSFYKDINS